MNKKIKNIASAMALASVVSSCGDGSSSGSMTMTSYEKDKKFLGKYIELVELKAGEKMVLLTPDYQGRVMTSSAEGVKGDSFGWINRALIESGEILPNCNNWGGEDRMWCGPEGGQFSIFFPSDNFDFENWHVPSVIDTDKWLTLSNSDTKATFGTTTTFTNVSGTKFNCRMERDVELLTDAQIGDIIGMELPEGSSVVGFSSKNRITNIGTKQWTKQGGTLSIWILGQFITSEDNHVVIPTKGDKGIVSDYFGQIPADRLKQEGSTFYFKADGKMRGKLGVLRESVMPMTFALDRVNGLLTVVTYSLDADATDYVNSRWALQDEPFEGDVINAYNDGPLEDGTIMGGFYEIESSSQALLLGSGETFEHIHTTIHIQGDVAELEALLEQLLNA